MKLLVICACALIPSGCGVRLRRAGSHRLAAVKRNFPVKIDMDTIRVLALDLEGTLISNAMSQIARPGLYAFLEKCRTLFERVVMNSVEQERAAGA